MSCWTSVICFMSATLARERWFNSQSTTNGFTKWRQHIEDTLWISDVGSIVVRNLSHMNKSRWHLERSHRLSVVRHVTKRDSTLLSLAPCNRLIYTTNSKWARTIFRKWTSNHAVVSENMSLIFLRTKAEFPPDFLDQIKYWSLILCNDDLWIRWNSYLELRVENEEFPLSNWSMVKALRHTIHQLSHYSIQYSMITSSRIKLSHPSTNKRTDHCIYQIMHIPLPPSPDELSMRTDGR